MCLCGCSRRGIVRVVVAACFAWTGETLNGRSGYKEAFGQVRRACEAAAGPAPLIELGIIYLAGMELESDNYDVLVIGTGLSESLAAA